MDDIPNIMFSIIANIIIDEIHIMFTHSVNKKVSRSFLDIFVDILKDFELIQNILKHLELACNILNFF
jgi:hypothetical protein